MDRRKYLISVASLSAIAGCTSDSEDTENPSTDNTTTEPTDETETTEPTEEPGTETETETEAPEPANLSVNDLSVSSSSVSAGESVQVTVEVINEGEEIGTRTVALNVNREETQAKEVELDGGDSTSMNFSLSRGTAGTYTITVDGEETTFTVQAQPELEIKNNHAVEDTETRVDGYVEVLIKNTGNAPSWKVFLTSRWFDQEGFIGEDDISIPSLKSGETWLARITPLGIDFEDIDDYELSGEFGRSAGHPIEGLEISESRYNENDRLITARAENNREDDLRFANLFGKLYDSQGRVLTGRLDRKTNVSSSEELFFEVNLAAKSRAYSDDEIDEHRVELRTGGSTERISF